MKFNLGDKVKIKSNGVVGIIIARGYNEYLDDYDKHESFEEYQIEADKYHQCNEDEIELCNPIIEEGEYLTKDIMDCKMFVELTGSLKPQEIKNVKVEDDVINPFMEEYERIVNETVELCKRKNADYGSSVQDTYEKFGDVSYLVRITDKYNRICSLLENGKVEVRDESITDTIVDLANYCFLWASSRNLQGE